MIKEKTRELAEMYGFHIVTDLLGRYFGQIMSKPYAPGYYPNLVSADPE